jgi:hypothetical protein
MPSRHKLLHDLLLTLFRSNEDNYEAIAAIDYPQMQMLLAALAGPNSSRIAFANSAVQQLEAHGLVGPPLFDPLAARFPARKALIGSVRSALTNDDQNGADDPRSILTNGESTLSAVEVAAHEKIMGDRPTFLDVHYLNMGYTAARAVVKLRMRFSSKWYLGTAFLISPSQLLTAYHNLAQPSGEMATEVTAQFDYERSLDGPEAEGRIFHCLCETIHGEPEDDWAVINLSENHPDCPPVRLSTEPAKVDDRVAIIQHPNGMAKQVALHNNRVTFTNQTRLQYLTDTLPGSSGAPVFDSAWRVVAVHHAGGDLTLPGTKELVYRNQGTPIARIRERMTELGVLL